MEILKNKNVKNVTISDLFEFESYPFSYDFAVQFLVHPQLVMEFTNFEEFLQEIYMIENGNIIENGKIINILNSEKPLVEYLGLIDHSNKGFLKFFGFNGEEFLLINEICYYSNLKSNIYWNLKGLKFDDLVIASIIYVLSVDLKKQQYTSHWGSVIQFLLESPFYKKLIFFLKKQNFLRKDKNNIMIGFIKTLEIQNRFKKKKYKKQQLIDLFEFLEIDKNISKLIIKNYLSVFNDQKKFINLLKQNINI